MKARYHKETAGKALAMIYPSLSREMRGMIIHADLMVDYQAFFRYRRELHFDRIPFASHESAWDASILAMRYHVMSYRWNMSCGRVEKSCKELGVIMHIIQDFFSHSNAADLPPQQQEFCIDQLLAMGEWPSMLWLTSFGVLNLFGSRLDDFSHKEHHMDSPDKHILSLTSRTLALFLKRYPLEV